MSPEAEQYVAHQSATVHAFIRDTVIARFEQPRTCHDAALEIGVPTRKLTQVAYRLAEFGWLAVVARDRKTGTATYVWTGEPWPAEQPPREARRRNRQDPEIAWRQLIGAERYDDHPRSPAWLPTRTSCGAATSMRSSAGGLADGLAYQVAR